MAIRIDLILNNIFISVHLSLTYDVIELINDFTLNVSGVRVFNKKKNVVIKRIIIMRFGIRNKGEYSNFKWSIFSTGNPRKVRENLKFQRTSYNTVTT